MDRIGMKRGAIALLVVLALMLLVPVQAMARIKTASRPHASVTVTKDSWENDDTTATAKVLPEISIHSLSSSVTTADADFSRITAEATGTPFVLETEFISGLMDLEMKVYKLADDGSLVELNTDDDSDLWDSYGSTIYFSAPVPGTYYVKVHALSDDTDDLGWYTFYQSKGIARRISGANRFATAARVSQTMFPDSNNFGGEDESPSGVIIANGLNFPDALAGAAFSAMDGGDTDNYPILFVTPAGIPAETRAEFQRLSIAAAADEDHMKVFVLGSTTVVPDSVVNDLVQLGSAVTAPEDIVRLAGTNRFGTAAAIASQTVEDYGAPDTVFIVTGSGFADALSASAVAAANESPILYSGLTALGAETSQWIKDHPSVSKAVIVGSSSVVGNQVASALATAPYSLDVTRVAGASRYETARALAEFGIAEYGMKPNVVLVSGTSFPDGLVAGSMCGFTDGVVLLTPGTALSPSVTTFFKDHRAGILPVANGTSAPSYVVGGAPAVSNTVFADFKNLYKLP